MAEKIKPVHIAGSFAVSSLGLGTEAHWNAVAGMRPGIRHITDAAARYGITGDFPCLASLVSDPDREIIKEAASAIPAAAALTPFEMLGWYAGVNALREAGADPRETLLVLASTKGNIELLGQLPESRMLLSESAARISVALGITETPAVVSLACVSGVVAVQTGMRLLQANPGKKVLVLGCDRFSSFVYSGFRSFQAVSDEPCRPFDAARKGITLGEAAAALVLAHEPSEIAVLSGATSNDANHISGPSRTGDELAAAISRALALAGVQASDIGMLSAHGTATPYNDEMEARAFYSSGLSDTPVHSLKGFIGHTLGAAGVIESVLLAEALRRGILIPSPGFSVSGVSRPLRVITSPEPAEMRLALKTASGFGGCNATLVLGLV